MKSGQVMPMRDDGSMFLLKLWCRKIKKVDGGGVASDFTAATNNRKGFPRQD